MEQKFIGMIAFQSLIDAIAKMKSDINQCIIEKVNSISGGDGIDVKDGVVSVDLAENSGLELVDGKLKVALDNTLVKIVDALPADVSTADASKIYM